MIQRPDGQRFEAVDVLRTKTRAEDKFLIYDLNDGSVGEIPFVMKSSRRKVDMLFKLDRDGNDRPSSETGFLDVLHSHCKGWKTYTLSYYDSILREIIRLATMECPSENHKCCDLFFKTINRMMAEYAKDEGRFQDATLNPFHLKDDENGANKIGMRAVSGETFVNERTSSCEFHIDKNVTKRKSHIVKESQEYYC